MKTNTTEEYNQKHNINMKDLWIEYKKDPSTFLTQLNGLKRYAFFTDSTIKQELINTKMSFYNPSSLLSILINNMSVGDMKLFFDEVLLSLISNNKYRSINLATILLTLNPYLKDYIKGTPLMDYIVLHLDEVNGLIDNMNISLAKVIFEDIFLRFPEKITAIKCLGEQAQIAVIKNLGIGNFYLITKDMSIFDYLSNTTISFLISSEPFMNYFVNLPVEDILKQIAGLVIIPYQLSNNKMFIEKISHISDTSEYRFTLNSILSVPNEWHSTINKRHRYNALVYLQEKGLLDDETSLLEVKDELDSLPISFNPDTLELAREKYDDEVVDSLEVSSLTSIELANKLGSLLIDRYFKDIPYNFLANLKMMFQFYASYPIDRLPLSKDDLQSLKKRLIIYERIVSLADLSPTDQISFYHSLDDGVNYVATFYDDYLLARELAYQDMNDKVFNPMYQKHLINTDLSRQSGVLIYELTGEEFYAYIHVTHIPRSETSSFMSFNQSHLFLKNPLDVDMPPGFSLSLISSKKMTTVRPVTKYISYGFTHLNPKRIAHVYHADSYSIYSRHSTGTYKVNDILTASDLVQKTRRYNEILYQEINDIILDDAVRKNYLPLQPDFLCCYDVITNFDISLAKKTQLPIVLIHQKNYPMVDDNYNDYNSDNEYMQSSYDISKQYLYE